MSGIGELEFVGGGFFPVQYDVKFDTDDYYIRYRWGNLEIYRNFGASIHGGLVFETQLGDEYDGCWNARETNVYLTIIAKAIRNQQFHADDFPTKGVVREHENYELGPLPLYLVGLSCGFDGPSADAGMHSTRHVWKRLRVKGLHVHDDNCQVWLPANQIIQWFLDHPEKHERLRAAWAARIAPSWVRELELELEPINFF